jgi:hypothetical protein
MHIEITGQEQALLLKIVEKYYTNLRAEISKPEGQRYKEDLQAEEALVQSILIKLGSDIHTR